MTDLEDIQISKRYLVNGMTYEVFGSEEFHKKMEEDHDFAFKYIEENKSNIELKFESGEGTGIWMKDATLLLLQEYMKRKESFNDPKIKKKLLWTEICKILNDRGFDASPCTCDRKFRNLKQTFLKNLQIDPKTVSWGYFDIFLEIMKGSKIAKPASSVSSESREDEDMEEMSSSLQIDDIRAVASPPSPQAPSSVEPASASEKQALNLAEKATSSIQETADSVNQSPSFLQNINSAQKVPVTYSARNASRYTQYSFSSARRALSSAQQASNSTPLSKSTLFSNNSTRRASYSSLKQRQHRRLELHRNMMVELETQKVEELKKLRMAMERSNELREEGNDILQENNELLKRLIEKQLS